MASQELQRGSNAGSMAWSENPGISTLHSSKSTPIEHERFFNLVERRSRKRRAKMADAASPGRSTQQNAYANAAALHGGSARTPGPVWKPKPLPRLHLEGFVIILKPRVTVAPKDVYQHAELEAAYTAYLGTQAAASLSLLPA
ncbi:hypothetical protein HPB50_009247 [Hyalomma asiaticum]|uniref:Uncharacterized protein n=1 Tax=Hyalomma asiaticum TaxID=266040 RepID=A0ACB7T6J8_HYAAI|nr:hypothetical protein HPB50_009247 [Hyalomma asiaticum]